MRRAGGAVIVARMSFGKGRATIAAVAAIAAVPGSAGAAAWSLQSTVDPGGVRGTELFGVSCIAPSACTAVGVSHDLQARRVTLAERWDGTNWTVQPTPNPSNRQRPVLNGISCVARTCTAVGFAYIPAESVSTPLAERWNGSKWVLMPATNPGGVNGSALLNVSCTAPTACVAVGYSNPNSLGAYALLAERWNGVTWTPQKTPTDNAFMEGISCASSVSCEAVGDAVDQLGNLDPTAMGWNGRSWTIQPMPEPAGATDVSPSEVKCSAPTACTAVGYYLDAGGTWLPLAERWDGSHWTMQSVPTPSDATLTELFAVSCPADDACTATGFYRDGDSTDVPLAERWDGSQWTLDPVPSPDGLQWSFLGDVSCTTASACTAVGGWRDNAETLHTLAEARQ